MAEQLFGKWELHHAENVEDYLKAIGTGFLIRKVATSITSCEEIRRNGEEWEILITSTFKNASHKFKLNEEFREDTMDGRKVKSSFSLEGGKLILSQIAVKEEDENALVTREVQDDGMLLITLTAVKKDVTAKRFYKRISS